MPGDTCLKQYVAKEMLRVLKKLEGSIIWYDFWLCSTNPNTKDIQKKKSFENNAQIAHLNSI